jgi:hypothetical protein
MTATFWQNTFTATLHRTSTDILQLPVSLSRLLGLLAESGEDDYGAKGPAQFAFWKAFSFVSDAISLLGEDFACSPSVDSDGGIRVTWRRGDRIVKLVCPAAREMPVYLYRASPNGNSLRNEGVTTAVLAEWLSWLINRASTAAG